jgi:hypothetical protein
MWAESVNGDGLHAVTHSVNHAAVAGINDSDGTTSWGVWGRGSPAGHFESSKGNCIEAVGTFDTDAIVATTTSPNHAAVAGHNSNGGFGVWASSTNSGGQGGIGLYAKGFKYAGQFDGPVVVAGQLTAIPPSGGNAMVAFGDVEVRGKLNVTVDVVLTGADFAEDFAVNASQTVQPGTIMVLDENGVLRPCDKSYDRKVLGVISGAGDYKPGLILDRQKSAEGRLPVALLGKVCCKVDATYGPIEVGDLLTTSPTSGHAMKACDPVRSFGAVLGKALRSLHCGKGLIPILVALQ